MNRPERIKDILTKTFSPSHLELINDSHKHINHNPDAKSGTTHFHVIIEAKAFEGVSLVQRHRLINDALKEEFDTGLHALKITAKAS